MFSALKKITIIVLFIITSVLSSSYFLIYSGYLFQHRSEVRNFINSNIKSDNASFISINPSELFVNSKTISWEDENKEVVYAGVLYDIVCMKNEGGKVILTAISDEQEQEIKKQFAENLNENSTDRANDPLKLLKQFLALKYISNNDLLKINSNQIINEYQSDHALKLVSVFISTEALPPNQFV